MEKWIQEHIKDAELKFGLDNYRFKTFSLHRDINTLKETVYTLSLEWLPGNASTLNEGEDEGTNPPGTAVISIDLNTKRYSSVIFVQGQSDAGEGGVVFDIKDEEGIVQWIESETGLTYGKHFEGDSKRNDKIGFNFKSMYKAIRTAPSGSINIEFDEAGKLVFFSVIGSFPSDETIIEESYRLTFKDVEPSIFKRLTLTEIPVDDKKQWVPVYALDEFYFTQSDGAIIPIEVLMKDRHIYIPVNRLLEWEGSLENDFESKPIFVAETITTEQVITKEQHPELAPIEESEIESCMDSVVTYMRKAYSEQSGEWVLVSLYRSRGYIYAELRRSAQDNRILKRKLQIIMDSSSFEVVNTMDSEFFLKMFEGYESAVPVVVEHEEAYAKLIDHMVIEPAYVYDNVSGKYRLCGRVDCNYCVDAITGEVVELNSLR
ncbi:hypothetical protein I6N90_06895 [Paenibacillus sp. GSMTC-2017]|uniref:hypothetical protein n=1 Tax=Paenibacillus sp. GSMTC-2017 TaxID=2794350 RepID=UPI0018D6AD3F|nr:hypothetical protein [Paenibacillus sp. GSMTC-2017]MBH5317543.1 hypothetical protein [Paenibacillus sp. GSMTC-2017]